MQRKYSTSLISYLEYHQNDISHVSYHGNISTLSESSLEEVDLFMLQDAMKYSLASSFFLLLS